MVTPDIEFTEYDHRYGVVPPDVELVNRTDCPASIVLVVGVSEIVGSEWTVTVFEVEQTDVGLAWDESTELKEYIVFDEGLIESMNLTLSMFRCRMIL